MGSFPNRYSAPMLVYAYVAGIPWGNKQIINMKHLATVFKDDSLDTKILNLLIPYGTFLKNCAYRSIARKFGLTN